MGGASTERSYMWVELVDDTARYINGLSRYMSIQEHLGVTTRFGTTTLNRHYTRVHIFGKGKKFASR